MSHRNTFHTLMLQSMSHSTGIPYERYVQSSPFSRRRKRILLENATAAAENFRAATSEETEWLEHLSHEFRYFKTGIRFSLLKALAVSLTAAVLSNHFSRIMPVEPWIFLTLYTGLGMAVLCTTAAFLPAASRGSLFGLFRCRHTLQMIQFLTFVAEGMKQFRCDEEILESALMESRLSDSNRYREMLADGHSLQSICQEITGAFTPSSCFHPEALLIYRESLTGTFQSVLERIRTGFRWLSLLIQAVSTTALTIAVFIAVMGFAQ